MISTHILDTSKGTPAAGVAVRLHLQQNSQWQAVSSGVTDADGRFAFSDQNVPGIYQITFEIEDYLKREAKEFFFLNAQVVFKVENTQRKYHVPLLLNPFGYSTYRGS